MFEGASRPSCNHSARPGQVDPSRTVPREPVVADRLRSGAALSLSAVASTPARLTETRLFPSSGIVLVTRTFFNGRFCLICTQANSQKTKLFGCKTLRLMKKTDLLSWELRRSPETEMMRGRSSACLFREASERQVLLQSVPGSRLVLLDIGFGGSSSVGASKTAVATETMSGYSTPDCSTPDLCNASNIRLILTCSSPDHHSQIRCCSGVNFADARTDPEEFSPLRATSAASIPGYHRVSACRRMYDVQSEIGSDLLDHIWRKWFATVSHIRE